MARQLTAGGDIDDDETAVVAELHGDAGLLDAAPVPELLGRRPAAQVDNAVLLRAATRALAAVGCDAAMSAGSTDANVAMAAGISAIAFGAYRGGGAHRLDEWVEPGSLSVGLRAVARLLEELATD